MKKSLIFLIFSLVYADTASFVLENDAIVGQDHHYTNGMYYTWMSENNANFPDVLGFIDLGQKNVAFSISHAIFTPHNKDISSKDLNDLPYAGYLDFNFLTYKSSANFFHELGLNMGMVGPSTQAETLQKSFHSLIGHDKPKGWDNQLDDEFMYGISYNIGYKTDPIALQDLSFDLTTNIRADLGNFYTGALIGATARLSSFPMHSFSTIGNFIGANESSLLNYEKVKNFNWALSLGVFYNTFETYYLIDEAIDQGYNLSKTDYMFGEKLALDFFYDSFKLSFYVKAINIDNKDSSSNNEKTGGISFVWKWD
ncbi:lipid A deacylase LpxR family protein [Sulfurospirillum oryzae]|uniref:lipid A deacylase LpxR family protein n=1 Tax=Sulfurospirillum oryzae TaxID=2976535 RepID=UPI0021E8C43F|nr:lipid A deacylase LpxR family protein [Sulfurospirillum oryzae]